MIGRTMVNIRYRSKEQLIFNYEEGTIKCDEEEESWLQARQHS